MSEDLINLIAYIEAQIDRGEFSYDTMKPILKACRKQLKELILAEDFDDD